MKYIIIGAGPGGLTLANRLMEKGERDFLVLEKEEEAGGLCRSREVDDSPLDIGGGHFLDVRRPHVNEFLFQFLPKEEWTYFERDSKIRIHGRMINSPIEANIWQMDFTDQVEYLKSIAIAGCNLDEPMPEKFIDWIYWKLGKKIAEDYMIPYNEKMFGENLNQLGTYWLEKLPNVSFEETLMSCLKRKAHGVQPGHAQFYYPKKYGYGELWRRMAEHLGDKIQYGVRAKTIDFEKRTVNGKYKGEMIINTAPWTAYERLDGLEDGLREDISCLKSSSVVITYYEERLDTEAHWIYCPEPKESYHRILVRHNFCKNSRGYWTETNAQRKEERKGRFSYENTFAYPLNTIGKREIMKRLLAWTKERGVIGLGRWGEWEHYNSDVVVDLALNLADKLTLRGI